MPRAALGTAREVYLGKSIEGVLRRREVRCTWALVRNQGKTCALHVHVHAHVHGVHACAWLGKAGVCTQVRELQHIFRNSFVCIRRFRASDCRLLPLVR